MVVRLVGLALFCLVFAGCQAKEPPAPDVATGLPPDLEPFFVMEPPQGPFPATMMVREFHLDGSTNLSATRELWPSLAFPVEGGVSAIFAQLTWDGEMDLDLIVSAPVDVCSLDGVPPEEFGQFGCATDPYFCVFGRGTWEDCQGTFGAPDSPDRLLIRGQRLLDVMTVCGDPCGFTARPISRYWPTPDARWTLDVQVFYGPSPWDLAAARPQAHLVEAQTLPGGSPPQRLSFQTFGVPAALVAELAWTSPLPTDMDLLVRLREQTPCEDSDCRYSNGTWRSFELREGSMLAPDGPLRFVIDGSQILPHLDACIDGHECAWLVETVAHDCPVPDPLDRPGRLCKRPQPVAYQLAATVFFGPVPDGFSLLQAAAPGADGS